uniref:Uncharacterized protein n=1 Tax=Arcella intermedia TaxID=1963864 RepID=A0A6B2L3F0_9EUKA
MTHMLYRCCTLYLVEKLGYQKELFEERPYDPSFLLRGIVLDKNNACFLHINHERKVVAAVHGTKRILTAQEIEKLYKNEPVAFIGVSNERYWGCTSYFEIPYLYTFAVLVDWYDSHSNEKDPMSSYENYQTINRHIFGCIEFIYGNHESWFFKEMNENTGKYIESRLNIRKYLEDLKKNTSTKVLLLTNSSYSYASLLLNYAFGSDWDSVFDLKIYSASKPYFFVQEKPFYELGKGGPKGSPTTSLHLNGNYCAGNSKQLTAFFNTLKEKSTICYFGDEVIGDILVPNQYAGWDTISIVEELEGLEKELGLDHFMGLTPITSDALHTHPIWDSFFHYQSKHTSFWANLIHHYSLAYLPCLSRLTHYQHDKKFRIHHGGNDSQNDKEETDEAVPLCTFPDGGEKVDVVVSSEALLEAMMYKNKIRMTTDSKPLVFNIRK